MQTEFTKDNDKGKDNENHVQVAVVTTAGSWPADGFEKTPIHQKISVFLKKAAKELNVISTDNWVAKANNRQLDTDKDFLENKLSGEITIDFGPVEGGGGQCE